MTIQLPKINVLLATYNGEAYLIDQLNSIFSQVGVAVTVYARDDGSSDSTVSILESYVASGRPIKLLSSIDGGGSAAKNFKELILNADVGADTCVCFADQDDIWLPTKLKTAVNIIDQGYDLYSSALTVFSTEKDGMSTLKGEVVFKDYDYLFQGLSAGCTYMLSSSFYSFVKSQIESNKAVLDAGFSHDWLIYTMARSFKYSIYHDSSSKILYRQHSSNVQGALTGIQGVLYRARNIWAHWYYDQIIFNRNFIRNTPDEITVLRAVEYKNVGFLIANCFKLRRGFLECLALLLFLLLRKKND
jgi:rhamnosyltransferase